MKLPQELRTVTPLSKTVAVLVFIALPIISFVIGMWHQQIIDVNSQIEMLQSLNTELAKPVTAKTLYRNKVTPLPTCIPRPPCLDSIPRCMIPETANMCPPAAPKQNNNQVACTQEAKLCPDGKSYVSRQGPNCEFAACPQ